MTRPPEGQRRHTTRLLSGLSAGMLVTALLGAGEAAASTKIYRTVDAQGNVVFTDVPPRPDQQGQAVELDEGSTFTPPPTPTAESAPQQSRMSVEQWLGGDGEPPAPGEEQAAPGNYQALEIITPGNDEAVRDNAGNVPVTTRLQPELASGHAMQVLLDGQLAQTGQTTSFTLTNVDRGTHSVQVRVVDANGNTVMVSNPAVFHLQRRSVILQPNKRAR